MFVRTAIAGVALLCCIGGAGPSLAVDFTLPGGTSPSPAIIPPTPGAATPAPALASPAPGVAAPAMDRQSAEAKLELLQRKIDDLDARLVKLNFILEQVKAVRSEDLPKLQLAIRGAVETAKRVEKDSVAAERSALVNHDAAPAGNAAADKGAAPAGGSKVGVSTPAAAPQTTEDKLADIDRLLKTLDDIYEQLDGIRNEDLPKLQRQVRGLHETSGRVEHKAEMPVQQERGSVIIENLSDFTREVTVNGVTYRIVPGAAEIPVPYKEVTTQIVGENSSYQWGMNYWHPTDRGLEMRFRLQ